MSRSFYGLIREKKEETMKIYSLFVDCRSGGEIKDSGLHAQKEYPNDNDVKAIAELRKIARKDLLPRFDEVICTVKKRNRVIGTFTLRRRSPLV